MQRIIATLLSILFSLTATCQKDNNMTGYSRKHLEKSLKHYIKQNNFQNCTITKTDTSILLSVRDTSIQNSDFYYHFTKSDICDEERKLTSCNSCLSKYLDDILSDTEYEWTKLNERLYVSKFSKKRIIEVIDNNNTCPYIKINKIKWNRKEYKKLVSQT